MFVAGAESPEGSRHIIEMMKNSERKQRANRWREKKKDLRRRVTTWENTF